MDLKASICGPSASLPQLASPLSLIFPLTDLPPPLSPPRPAETILAFSEECVNNVVEAYCPIIKKHMNDEYTEQQKQWQQLRRGRYVEFNLVYDRGTTFGLKTGGRIESILMSLPIGARWEYDQKPAPGSPEAELIDCCKNPRKWV